jgi:hypothetical protein
LEDFLAIISTHLPVIQMSKQGGLGKLLYYLAGSSIIKCHRQSDSTTEIYVFPVWEAEISKGLDAGKGSLPGVSLFCPIFGRLICEKQHM